MWQTIISICSVYRNPDADDGIFDSLLVSMAAIQENDRKASFVFIVEITMPITKSSQIPYLILTAMVRSFRFLFRFGM